METINLGLQIVPLGNREAGYSMVDKAIEVIRLSGVKYEVTAFETVMEGPQDKLMEVARKAQDAVLEAGAQEVLVYYRIHARKDAQVTIEEKTGKYR
jgi:uncharacterized protein (TIGR00106 family)